MKSHRSNWSALHKIRGVSKRASESLARVTGDRTGRPLSAKARQAGLAMIEAYSNKRFPSEDTVLTFFDEADPDHARWLRERIAEAEKIEREMELESAYGFSEDED
jgi:hypothetical protein